MSNLWLILTPKSHLHPSGKCGCPGNSFLPLVLPWAPPLQVDMLTSLPPESLHCPLALCLPLPPALLSSMEQLKRGRLWPCPLPYPFRSPWSSVAAMAVILLTGVAGWGPLLLPLRPPRLRPPLCAHSPRTHPPFTLSAPLGGLRGPGGWPPADHAQYPPSSLELC